MDKLPNKINRPLAQFKVPNTPCSKSALWYILRLGMFSIFWPLVDLGCPPNVMKSFYLRRNMAMSMKKKKSPQVFRSHEVTWKSKVEVPFPLCMKPHYIFIGEDLVKPLFSRGGGEVGELVEQRLPLGECDVNNWNIDFLGKKWPPQSTFSSVCPSNKCINELSPYFRYDTVRARKHCNKHDDILVG